MALAKSPLYLIPPSAMIGTSCFEAASAQCITAVSCGTPTPATTRVVQLAPAPIPTFTPLTPASINASTASLVATFPAMISNESPNLDFIFFTAVNTPAECPCAVSKTITSTSALANASARSKVS